MQFAGLVGGNVNIPLSSVDFPRSRPFVSFKEALLWPFPGFIDHFGGLLQTNGSCLAVQVSQN